ncbi:MAG: DUF4003 family protein [Lachnospiraceae bacterium]|nr:DUF4003 family protein [Lachnospiraceae bacterium]
MKEELKTLVQDYLDTKAVAEKAFAWENSYLPPICAAILLKAGRKFTKEELDRTRQLIKENTGVFSDYRGTAMAAMICLLASEPSPESAMEKSLKIYEELRKHFGASEYLPFVSMVIERLSENYDYEGVCARGKAIYEDMRSNHPFLTSREDVTNATLLAYSSMTDAQIVVEVENCYNELKKHFSSSNDVQALSQTLALGDGNWQDKCNRFLRIFEGLKSRGYKYSKDCRLATLGALSVLPVEENELIQDIIDVNDELTGKKGYGFFGFGKADKLMHAAMLVATYYGKKQNDTVLHAATIETAIAMAEINSTIAILAAQNAAMISSVLVATAASTSN